MVFERKGYVIRRGRHRCLARGFAASGSHPMVQRPACYDIAFEECLRLYDSGREGFGKGPLTYGNGETIISDIDAGEPAWAATARLWERDLAARAPASHAGADLEAAIAMKPVEQSLWCSGPTTEVDQRAAVA